MEFWVTGYNLKVDHLRTIHAMFALNRLTGFETTKRFEPNLAEMFIGWSYTRFMFLVLIGNPTNENTLWTLAAMLDFKSAPKTQIW
jgi:hypothetical protein